MANPLAAIIQWHHINDFMVIINITFVLAALKCIQTSVFRYRTLIRRYLSNSKARSSMLSRPGRTWLCRRGTKIAICGSGMAYQRRRGKRVHRRPRVAPARSVTMTISHAIDNEFSKLVAI